MTLSLSDLGWTTERETEFRSAADDDDLVPGRICRQQSGRMYAWTEAGEVEAVLPGRLEISIDIGTAETVDRLFRIADTIKKNLGAIEKGIENPVLNRIGILKFID